MVLQKYNMKTTLVLIFILLGLFLQVINVDGLILIINIFKSL